MWRDIRIGLHAEGDGAEGWMRVLRQERLPWDGVDGPDRPVVLFSGYVPSWCHAFVAGGGVAVIAEAPASDTLLGPSIPATLHRFRPPGRDEEAELPCLARLFTGPGEGECRLHGNRKSRSPQPADLYPAVLNRPHGKGRLIYTGLPLTRHLVAAGDTLRAFTTSSALTERVASVDKAEVADTLIGMLHTAFDILALPRLRIGRYPQAAHSVFILRIDVDGVFGNNCRRIAQIAQAHGIHCSFFFNAALCRAYPGALSRDWLDGHEIGHHGDVHDLFDTIAENRTNLLAGMNWVEQQLGLRPRGYVAPRGMWNHALDRAMADLALPYSSDFGLDIDSLPFFSPAGVLQVPVHPYSPERHRIFLEDAGLGPPGARAVLDHYLSVLARQVAFDRPVHLYGHPEILGDMADAVLPELFAAANSRHLPNMTLGDFADWWRRRDETSMTLAIDDVTGRLHVETDAESVDVRVPTATRLTIYGASHTIAAGHWARLPAARGLKP